MVGVVMNEPMRVRAGALALLLASLGARPAWAGDAQPAGAAETNVAREAKDLARAGIAEYRAGHLEQARAQFQKAWELKPSLELAASLAEVEMKLERYGDAAGHWEYYIQNLPPDRADAEFQLAECRKHLGSVRVAVDTPGAVVSMDGAVLGPAPLRVDVWVTPGAHVFDAKVADRAPAVQRIAIGAGEAQIVSLMLAATPANSEGSEPSSGGEPAKGDTVSHGSSARLYVAIGGGALSLAAVGVGVAFTLKSNTASDDAAVLRSQISSANGGGTSGGSFCYGAAGQASTLCQSYAKKLDDQTNAKGVAIAGYVAGSVLAVGTLVTALAWPTEAKAAAVPQFEVGRAGREGWLVSVRGRF
jgi:tetratricopeptide (TPR) repeat protein